MLSSVYIGIDVACATGKRLPICVVSEGSPLMPLTIPKSLAALVPRRMGNKEISAPMPFKEAACNVVMSINRIADELGWRIKRIAVDAPAAPPVTGSRASETELGLSALSSFRTPPSHAWPEIIEKCVDHLAKNGTAATLPHANKIWMLFGFELFVHLKAQFSAEVIEVYPFAIVRALLPACDHKSTEKGYQDQLGAVASRTGWVPQKLEARLKETVPGSRHDRLDAFMAAWVASLPADQRRAFGHAARPDDAIWVPL